VLGCAAFLAACGVHFLGYRRFLSPSLRDPDPGRRRAGLVGWVRFMVATQTAILALAVGGLLYAFGTHPMDYGRIAPPIGLILGNALPLQLEVLTIMRSARRL